MKYADIIRIREAGLISADQEKQILDHFKLKAHDTKFLTVICFLGAVLVAFGLILLVAANWQEIPRGVKIGAGLLLMLSAHGAGWYLREIRTARYPKVGEALHLAGSLLFLANIALIGQVYHLSSRPPDAILLWLLGIAALPWLLRSAAQFLLLLIASSIWFGMEINQQGSWIYFGENQFQLLLYSLLGLIVLGTGYCLRRTSYTDFAPYAEQLGMYGFQGFFWPLTWGLVYRHYEWAPAMSLWIFPVMAVVALGAVGLGVAGLPAPSPTWRLRWGLALAGGVALLTIAMYLAPLSGTHESAQNSWFRWLSTAGLFGFCLLEVQFGIRQRKKFLVDAGILFLALTIIATYINLFGSMARTGLMFLTSGILILAFGIYLEKKRRTLLQQLEGRPADGAMEIDTESEVA